MTPYYRSRSSLDQIALDSIFEEAWQDVVDSWESENVGREAIELTLRFMEDNPNIDYGAPGPLAYFMERFHGQGYEEALIASIRRHPTPHTVWLLNRLINGTRDIQQYEPRVLVLRDVLAHQPASGETRSGAADFFKRLDG